MKKKQPRRQRPSANETKRSAREAKKRVGLRRIKRIQWQPPLQKESSRAEVRERLSEAGVENLALEVALLVCRGQTTGPMIQNGLHYPNTLPP